jgi:hypothetical protein
MGLVDRTASGRVCRDLPGAALTPPIPACPELVEGSPILSPSPIPFSFQFQNPLIQAIRVIVMEALKVTVFPITIPITLNGLLFPLIGTVNFRGYISVIYL